MKGLLLVLCLGFPLVAKAASHMDYEYGASAPAMKEALPVVEEASPNGTVAAMREADKASFSGQVSAGAVISSRDPDTSTTFIARVDTLARLHLGGNENWQPRLRVRAEFGGYPGKAVDVGAVTSFNTVSLEAGLSERLFPGFEAGVHMGIAGQFRTSGSTARNEGPTWWAAHGRFYSGPHWIQVAIGQDQRLSTSWTKAAAVSVDAGYELPIDGPVKLALTGEILRSVYQNGGMVVRAAVVARVGR